MLGWRKHKLESRLPGEISITSDMQMTPPLLMAESEELKSLLMKVKEESEKVGETVEIVADFIFLGSKSLQMVTAAMKLKDAYSLEGKL